MEQSAVANDTGTAATFVADAVATMIMEELAPGTSLPSEAALAGRFGVSRLTLREALKLLEGRGLVVLSRGKKAVVREPDGAGFGDFLTMLISHDPKGLFDVIEVRLSLEVQAATLAAKRATRASLAGIENALAGMREAAGSDGTSDPEREAAFHAADVAFHEAVALASGNRVLGALYEAMAGPLREGFYISRRGHEQRGHTVFDTIAAHQRILDCIREGNGRAAADAMRFHLKDTERDIRMALSRLGRKG
jgi:GntR family transcriptional regulator, transcriptional repressor for pyruvate dehydrogenase complex